MTSPTDITKNRRAAKKRSAGTARKNKVRAIGTTPSLFVLNKPTQGEKNSKK